MKFILTSLAILLFSVSSFFAQEAPRVSGELIVQLNKTIEAKDLTIQLSEYNGVKSGIKLDRVLSSSASIYLFKYDNNRVPDGKILNFIYSNPGVEIAQFNHEVQNRALPNDPSISSQWHHVDASDNDIDSDLAWDITTGGQTSNGDEIVVCVIEGGGANYNHPDLIANHWTNTAEIADNGIDDDGNGYIDDFNGWNPVTDDDNVGNANHGTAVSGMIGAKGNNNSGGAGVNWDVKIMQVDLGSLTEANVIESYSYPLTMRERYNASNGAEGAFVVATNASWGIDNANPANYPVWCAFYDTLGAAGILNCGATSNSNINVDVNGDMPTGCSSNYMLGITATNSSDQRTFSGYGDTAIDLAAPGEAVFLPSGTSGYSSTSGTSFASPCVAGAIALLYSAPCSDIANQAISSPQNTADLVRNYIFNGVDVIPSLIGEVATGGRLNVKNSLDLLINECGPVEPCAPLSLTLETECVYSNGAVTASVTLSPTFNENLCTLGDVIYSELSGGNVTVDASAEDVGNGDSFTINGLASNTTYNFSFQTESGSSSIESITTGSCSSLTPGCMDINANNFNANANIDDGSCTYDCEDVTFTLMTDCYATEIAWTLISDDGTVLNDIVAGSLTDLTEYNSSGCLNEGCYTLTITDTYGDGLEGSAFGCAIDGTFSLTNDTDGTIIDELIDPNYGEEYIIDFCISVSQAVILGCTDSNACNYDQVATDNDGSCTYPGCTNNQACNYDQAAGCDDESCIIPPANDLCANAVSLSEGINIISNENACFDEGYSIPGTGCNLTDGWCTANQIENDVFYSFTTPAFAVAISLETSFSNPLSLNDTQMALFTDCGGTLVAANDDGGTDQYMSRLDFGCGELLANTTYLVLIDGYDGAEGVANLTLTYDGANCGTSGCTDPEAENYNPNATVNDGSCVYLCDNDTEAPVFTLIPSSVTLDCDDGPMDFGTPVITDNCDSSPSLVFIDEIIPGLCEGDYSISRVYTASDAAGNFTNYTQLITFEDNVAPTITNPPANITIDCTEDLPDFQVITANDNCSSEIIYDFDQVDNGNGSYTFIYTASDGCGNFSFVNQLITVEDLVSPEYNTSASDLVINCGDVIPEVPNLIAFDNCSSQVDVTFSEEIISGSGDGFTVVRTWLLEDESGNQTEFIQTIESLDNCEPNPCPADLNNNGSVEIADLGILLGDFGCVENCAADINGLLGVTVDDISIFLQAFGSSCQ